MTKNGTEHAKLGNEKIPNESSLVKIISFVLCFINNNFLSLYSYKHSI